MNFVVEKILYVLVLTICIIELNKCCPIRSKQYNMSRKVYLMKRFIIVIASMTFYFKLIDGKIKKKSFDVPSKKDGMEFHKPNVCHMYHYFIKRKYQFLKNHRKYIQQDKLCVA